MLTRVTTSTEINHETTSYAVRVSKAEAGVFFDEKVHKKNQIQFFSSKYPEHFRHLFLEWFQR